jgi:hypothetical protein
MLYKLRKIEATKWLKNGDHPKDNVKTVGITQGRTVQNEGEVVRYFRHPDFPGEWECLDCGKPYNDHGFIDQDSGIKVCPGSYVVTTGPDKYDALPAAQFEFFFKPA